MRAWTTLAAMLALAMPVWSQGFQELPLEFDFGDAADKYTDEPETLKLKVVEAVAKASGAAAFYGVPWQFIAVPTRPTQHRLQMKIVLAGSERQLESRLFIGAVPLPAPPPCVLVGAGDALPSPKALAKVVAKAFANGENLQRIGTAYRKQIPLGTAIVTPDEDRRSKLLVPNERFAPFQESTFSIRCPVVAGPGPLLAKPEQRVYANGAEPVWIRHDDRPEAAEKGQSRPIYLNEFVSTVPFSN